MSNIHESIRHLAVPLDSLSPLVGNPRKGSVDAIAASYAEFGQVKPIVIRRNADGSATVIAGNHQVEACRRLGWVEIAAVELAGDDARAIAYALADNRTNELGTTDSDLLYEMLTGTEGYDDLFETLGWDDFEFASMESDYLEDDDNNGYTPPVLRDLPETTVVAQDGITQVGGVSSSDAPVPKPELVAPPSVDVATAVTQGSPAVTGQQSVKAVVQYTLVFDSSEQQRKWYDFIRWLKADAGYDGEATAERLLSFIDAHSEY